MNYDLNEELKLIEQENIIWIIFLVIIGMNLVSNFYAEQYLFTKNPETKKLVRTINIILLIAAILIYIYYEVLAYNAYEPEHKTLQTLTLIAASLFLVGGIMQLYIEYKKYAEPEIAVI